MPQVLSLLQSTEMVSCLCCTFSKRDFVSENASICVSAAGKFFSSCTFPLLQPKASLRTLFSNRVSKSYVVVLNSSGCVVHCPGQKSQRSHCLFTAAVTSSWIYCQDTGSECIMSTHTHSLNETALKENKNMTTIFL